MKQPGNGPIDKRWVQAAAEGTADQTEQRMAALLNELPDAAPLSAGRLAAVAARLPGRRLPTSRRLLGVRFAIVLSFVLGSASAVFARRQIAELWQQVTGAPPPPLHPAAERRPRAAGKRAEVVALPTAATEERSTGSEASLPRLADAVPPPTSVRGSQPAPVRRSAAPAPARKLALGDRSPVASPGAPAAAGGGPRHRPPPAEAAPEPPVDLDALAALVPPPVAVTPSGPPPPVRPEETASSLMPLPALAPPAPASATSPLREEAALLRQAIHGLRVARRPSDALARLAEHRRRFPAGALATDAQILRVEALLALGRRAEARAALDDHRLAGEGNGRTLQVTRAELLADRSCTEAIAVFDDLLQDPSASAATIERALRGRAICHQRNGNPAAATNDWQTYLTRFPTGRFAPAARQHLRR